MAKYDWNQLKKEYILGDYKSVSQFIKSKKMPYNGTTKTKTKGWSEEKRLKQDQKTTKVIEKVIEKESEAEAQKIVDVKDVAQELLNKIIVANSELNMHLARNKKKTKIVEYDYDCNKPSKEVVDEKEEITSYIDIIDRQGLKQLTSALKDLSEILNPKNSDGENDNNEDNSFVTALNGKTEEIWNEEKE